MQEFSTMTKVFVALAGGAGTLVYLLQEGKELSWAFRALTLLGGVATAHFLTHPIIHAFNLATIDEGPGTGFVLGLFGMSILGAGIRLIKAIDWGTVRGFLPGGK
jgi:hypothetical protein